MPANLSPDYYEAEKRFKEARTNEEKIKALQEMLAVIPKHKGTDKMQADLKHRISKLKEESQKKKGAVKQKSMYLIDTEGAAQIVIIGPPNTGKSSLVAALTNASPEISPFPHSTHKPIPGMALFENVQFQLIDTPPLTEEYVDPQMIDMIRRSDIVVILLDTTSDLIGQYEYILSELAANRIFPEGAVLEEGMKRPVTFKKMIILVNKTDAPSQMDDFNTFTELVDLKVPAIPVSILNSINLDTFLKTVFDLLDIMRVYSKYPGREPDLNEPFVLPKDSTLEELAGRIHKDFLTKLKFARVWGKSAHSGQMIQRDHVLKDGDVVELHI
ncbi:MAG TPA: GTPase [Desulfomonilia bacterium]